MSLRPRALLQKALLPKALLCKALLSLALLITATLAQAHNLGTSYSHWQLDQRGAEVQARVTELQLSRLQLDPRYTPDYLSVVGKLLADKLQFWANEQPCPASHVQARRDSEGWVTASWRVDCPHPAGWLIRTRLFETVAPSHLHFVRVDTAAPAAGEGNPAQHIAPQAPQQRVLSFAAPTLVISQTITTPNSLMHFIEIGIRHILGGTDHLAFIFMLILLARSLREVALVATGFTIAHSLTLAAASLGWVVVHQARVEALIGFSIALVAAENLWLRSARDVWIPRLLILALLAFSALAASKLPLVLMAALVLFSACYFGLLAQTKKPLHWRLALTFIFGLVHGFGFAGLMGEMHLPPAQLTLGLLGFNIGVELGQLAVIALIWPLLLLLRRTPRVAGWASESFSAAIAGLGVFWFVTRLLV
ncbi:MAG: HupE/UreJ family protein [Paraperlucidibaca sp.]